MSSPSHFLPDCTSPRELVHTRSVTLQAFRRQDGNWDLEAVLEDVKPRDIETALRRYPGGVPIHLMAVRLTVDRSLQVIGAVAAVGQAPFAGVCNGVESSLERLVGTNLLRGFRREVADRIGPIERCTHISELLSLFPTLAIQALGPSVPSAAAAERPPAQMDRCRGWQADGEAVRVAYPKWYRPKAKTNDA